MAQRRHGRVPQSTPGDLVRRSRATAVARPSSDPATRVRAAGRRLLSAVLRGFLAIWIALQIFAGFLILPYARLFFHGLDRLATEFPGSQRWRLFSEARSRYERWRRWCRQRSALTRLALFVSTAGSAAFLWWLSTRSR